MWQRPASVHDETAGEVRGLRIAPIFAAQASAQLPG